MTLEFASSFCDRVSVQQRLSLRFVFGVSKKLSGLCIWGRARKTVTETEHQVPSSRVFMRSAAVGGYTVGLCMKSIRGQWIWEEEAHLRELGGFSFVRFVAEFVNPCGHLGSGKRSSWRGCTHRTSKLIHPDEDNVEVNLPRTSGRWMWILH